MKDSLFLYLNVASKLLNVINAMIIFVRIIKVFLRRHPKDSVRVVKRYLVLIYKHIHGCNVKIVPRNDLFIKK